MQPFCCNETPLDVNFCYVKGVAMKKKFALILFMLFVAANCFADELSLMQKINYKEVKIMSPIGQETDALVNRFTGKVEYIWNGNTWTTAPQIFQKNYQDRRRLHELDKRNKEVRSRIQRAATGQ